MDLFTKISFVTIVCGLVGFIFAQSRPRFTGRIKLDITEVSSEFVKGFVIIEPRKDIRADCPLLTLRCEDTEGDISDSKAQPVVVKTTLELDRLGHVKAGKGRRVPFCINVPIQDESEGDNVDLGIESSIMAKGVDGRQLNRYAWWLSVQLETDRMNLNDLTLINR
jgi:hypothetical protein